jgi:hypothetical protein
MKVVLAGEQLFAFARIERQMGASKDRERMTCNKLRPPCKESSQAF